MKIEARIQDDLLGDEYMKENTEIIDIKVNDENLLIEISLKFQPKLIIIPIAALKMFDIKIKEIGYEM